MVNYHYALNKWWIIPQRIRFHQPTMMCGQEGLVDVVMPTIQIFKPTKKGLCFTHCSFQVFSDHLIQTCAIKAKWFAAPVAWCHVIMPAGVPSTWVAQFIHITNDELSQLLPDSANHAKVPPPHVERPYTYSAPWSVNCRSCRHDFACSFWSHSCMVRCCNARWPASTWSCVGISNSLLVHRLGYVSWLLLAIASCFNVWYHLSSRNLVLIRRWAVNHSNFKRINYQDGLFTWFKWLT